MTPGSPHGWHGGPGGAGHSAPSAQSGHHTHPPYYPAMPGPPATGTPPEDSKAMAAMILGFSSITCFGFLTGIPAIVLGSLARRDASRVQSTQVASGTRGLALTGIVTGMLGTGMSLVAIVFALSSLLAVLQGTEPASTAGQVAAPVITPGTHRYGTMEIVDLEEKKGLGSQLHDLAQATSEKGRILILQTYVRSSQECADIANAMPDARMQRALENVTLVRVDVDVFEHELLAMRVDTETLPWFYKLDGAAHIVDAVSADEWDDNTAPNMARILGEFAEGSLSTRRRPAPLGTEL